MVFFNRYFVCGLIIVLVIGIAACKKDNDIAPTPAITIDIKSPVQSGSYQPGDTVKIQADVTSDVDLHGYEWTITAKTGNVILASSDDHVHGKTFTIDDNYINNVTATTEAELKVVVEVDHEGNESSKTISFTLNQ